jgi:CspA family cold shock protein
MSVMKSAYRVSGILGAGLVDHIRRRKLSSNTMATTVWAWATTLEVVRNRTHARGGTVKTVRPKGTVKWFNSQKGYGFTQPQGGGKDVFVHISAVERAGLSGRNEGQIVEFEEVSSKGKKISRKPEGSALTLVGLSPADHCGFDPAAGFNTFPYASLLADEQVTGAVQRQAALLLGVLVATNRMFGLVTASQIASASVASFLCRFTQGFT